MKKEDRCSYKIMCPECNIRMQSKWVKVLSNGVRAAGYGCKQCGNRWRVEDETIVEKYLEGSCSKTRGTTACPDCDGFLKKINSGKNNKTYYRCRKCNNRYIRVGEGDISLNTSKRITKLSIENKENKAVAAGARFIAGRYQSGSR